MPDCMDVCAAELARAATIVCDVTSYLLPCGNPQLQLPWDLDIWLELIKGNSP